METVLVVGQIKPDTSGQAVVINNIVKGSYTSIRVVHCNFHFSKDVAAMGRFKPDKLLRLVLAVWDTITLRLQFGPGVLYYPVAGPYLIPILRDLIFLGCTRWMFRYTVFHFHAATTSKRVMCTARPLRSLLLKVYGRADCAILTAPQNYSDGVNLGAAVTRFLPNGIADHSGRYTLARIHRGEVRLLYLSLIEEEKGIFVLLEACRRLKADGLAFHLAVVGPFATRACSESVRCFVSTAGLSDNVELLGQLVGEGKWSEYERADIFCFPSHHPSESFGLVVLEAMQFALPVVAARWGGVQSVVAEGSTGLLFEPKDSPELASTLRTLIGDKGLRDAMGAEGRRRFLQEFTVSAFQRGFESIIESVTGVNGHDRKIRNECN